MVKNIPLPGHLKTDLQRHGSRLEGALTVSEIQSLLIQATHADQNVIFRAGCCFQLPWAP